MTNTHKTVLNQLIDEIDAGAIEYVGRADDIHSLEGWIKPSRVE